MQHWLLILTCCFLAFSRVAVSQSAGGGFGDGDLPKKIIENRARNKSSALHSNAIIAAEKLDVAFLAPYFKEILDGDALNVAKDFIDKQVLGQQLNYYLIDQKYFSVLQCDYLFMRMACSLENAHYFSKEPWDKLDLYEKASLILYYRLQLSAIVRKN